MAIHNKEYNIQLDYSVKLPIPKMIFIQGDNACKINATISDNLAVVDLTSLTAKLMVKKADNTLVYQTLTIPTPATNGIVQIALTSNTLGAVGTANCEITINDINNNILTTLPFTFTVLESYSNNIASTNEFNELLQANQDANNTVATINNETLVIYKPYVSTYSDIATTYPTPQNGWETVAIDTNTRYRYNSTLSQWVAIDVAPYNKIGDLSQIPETNLTSAILNDRSSLNDKPSQSITADINFKMFQAFNFIRQLSGSVNFIGDSITQGYGVSNVHKSYSALIAQAMFDENNVQDYETIFNLVTDTDFTFAGGTHPGSSGGAKQSVIMPVGATITFTRALNYLCLWFNKTPTSGKVEIRKNGTLLTTTDLSGTSDANARTAFPLITTTNEQATYEIKCINADVEIIAVVCAKTSNKSTHFNRFAVSGVSTSYYIDTNTLNALLTQGSFYSSKTNIFILALGTNDIYQNSGGAVISQTYKNNLRTIIDFLVNNGQIPILTVPPRSDETKYAPIYEPHANYKAKVLELALEYGLQVIDYSKIDFVNAGLYNADGVHPNDAGHIVMAKFVMEELNKDLTNTAKNGIKGVIHYWSFREPIGNVIKDYGKKNAILIGTTRVNGLYKNARKFNGSSDYGIVKDIVIPSDNFTITFNLPVLGDVSSTVFQYILSCIDSSLTAQFGLLKYHTVVYVSNKNGTYATVCNISDLVAGKYALKISGGYATLYINGVAKTPVAIGVLTITSNLYFGVGALGGSLNYYFDGALEEVTMWDYALSDAEIAAIANSQSSLI